MKDLGPEAMMKACTEAVRSPPVAWSTRYKGMEFDLGEDFLDMITELILLLHEEGLLFVGEKWISEKDWREGGFTGGRDTKEG